MACLWHSTCCPAQTQVSIGCQHRHNPSFGAWQSYNVRMHEIGRRVGRSACRHLMLSSIGMDAAWCHLSYQYPLLYVA